VAVLQAVALNKNLRAAVAPAAPVRATAPAHFGEGNDEETPEPLSDEIQPTTTTRAAMAHRQPAALQMAAPDKNLRAAVAPAAKVRAGSSHLGEGDDS